MVRRPPAYGSVLLCVYPDVDTSQRTEEGDEPYRSAMFADDALDQRASRAEGNGEESQHVAEDMNLDTDADWTEILDNQPIVLNDRMMTDAMQSPHIQSEHSYSLTLNDEMPQSPFGMPQNMKIEDYSKEMETECFPAVSISSTAGQSEFPEVDVLIKQEPPSPPPHECSPSRSPSSISSLLGAPSSPTHPQSVLKQPTIVLAARPPIHTHQSSSVSGSSLAVPTREQQLLYPKVSVKIEPHMSSSGFPLPPTPPSCNSSDSDGSLSPVHTLRRNSPPPASHGSSISSSGVTSSSRKSQAKVLLSVTSAKHASANQTSLISSQPKGATGLLLLTEEEKRTLLAEGYPIPQRLPLTKAEERSLKKIRRKIKNKISAQESRRKKKEYMDALEKKVEVLASENNEYKKKLESLEGNNKSLLSQLQQLQAILSDLPHKQHRNAATQTAPFTAISRHEDISRKIGSAKNVQVTDNFNAKGR